MELQVSVNATEKTEFRTMFNDSEYQNCSDSNWNPWKLDELTQVGALQATKLAI